MHPEKLVKLLGSLPPSLVATAGIVLGLSIGLPGFFYLEAKEETGTIVTKPFKLEGKTLQVNVDAVAGYVKVELLDTEGNPIADFSGDQAKVYRGYDCLRLEPRWKDQPDLSSLTGKEVRLRFTLEQSKLYAFQIVN